MIIDFDELRKQSVDKDVLIDLLEHMYKLMKSTKDINIMFNEICKVNKTVTNEFNIVLSKVPVSASDMIIHSQDGSITITPAHIVKVDKNTIYINNKNIRQLDYVYVTYKY